MGFKDIDQMLINECSKDVIDIERIKALIDEGSNINAFDEEHQQSLYDVILDFYVFEGRERRLNLSSLYQITEIFIENNLILNPKAGDSDYYLPNRFRFLPPETVCVDALKVLLKNGKSSFEDIQSMITNASFDLHLGMYYFFEQKQYYSRDDSLNYYLELIYWSCAYMVKEYPEKSEKDLLDFDWFDREKNKVELICEDCSTSVFIEDLETHNRVEIDGWTATYYC